MKKMSGVKSTIPIPTPLQDNGGPTFTHALLPGSPAIDAGDDSAAPATDQQGVARLRSSASDIGASEVVLPGGTILWIRQFGSSQDDTAEDVEIDREGNVYVLGWTYFGALPGQTHLGESDAFVRKYDKDGNAVWTHQFGTEIGDSASDAEVGGGAFSVPTL